MKIHEIDGWTVRDSLFQFGAANPDLITVACHDIAPQRDQVQDLPYRG
ncbi:MAG: hypothetical protein AAF800_14495 [Planctomycetota bacterium]